jgi:glycosyltransferase involved in cell wall biosynthesis
MMLPAYSLVVPVYNSEKSLGQLCQRIDGVFKKLKDTYEIILIDDSSKDDSWNVMKELRKKNSNIKIIRLMRNFGQHNAIMCGLHQVSGKYVILLDDDLQNPPEEIPKLIHKINDGYDAVIGALEEKQDTLLKKLGSQFILYLNGKIFNKPKHIKLSSFKILTRPLVDQLKILKTPYPYITGMVLSLSMNIANVTVKHETRRYGRSNYNLGKLLKLSFNLIINYTSLPLRALTLLGVIISTLSFCAGIYFITRRLFDKVAVPGWTSVVVLLSFFNGLLLVVLSVIGEYLARIIGEVSNRPQFVIKEKHI